MSLDNIYLKKKQRQEELEFDTWAAEAETGAPAPQQEETQQPAPSEQPSEQQGAIAAGVGATAETFQHGITSLGSGLWNLLSAPASQSGKDLGKRVVTEGVARVLDGLAGIVTTVPAGVVHGVGQAIANRLPTEIAEAKIGGVPGSLIATALQNFSAEALAKNLASVAQQPLPEEGFGEAAGAVLGEMAAAGGVVSARDALEAAAILVATHGQGKVIGGLRRAKRTPPAAPAAPPAAPKGPVTPQRALTAGPIVAPGAVAREAKPVARALTIEDSVEWQGQRKAALLGPNDFSMVAKGADGQPKGWLWGTQVEGGFQVRKVETAGRGTGAGRELYREAYDRYGPYKGSTDLTPEGEGFQARLRETDPDIFQQRPMAEVEPADFTPLPTELAEFEQPLRTAVEKALLTGDEPTARIISEERGMQMPTAAERATLRADLLNAVGGTDPGTMLVLARTALGGAVGATQGDTLEERMTNALVGAVGAAAAPVLVKGIMTHLPESVKTALQDETGAASFFSRKRVVPGEPMPNFGRIHAEAQVKQILKSIHRDVITPKDLSVTKPTTFKAIESEAQGLLDSGAVTADKVMGWNENTVVGAAELTAARTLAARSAVNVQQLAARVLAGDRMAATDLAASLEIAGKLNQNVMNVRTGIARAEAAGRIKVKADEPVRLTPEVLADSATRLHGEWANLTPEQLAGRIAALRTSELPRVLGRWDLIKEHGPDMLLELTYGMRLSGPMTRVRNITGNSAMIPVQLFDRAVAAQMERIAVNVGWKETAAVVPGETSAMISAMRASFGDAIRMYKEVLKTGESKFGDVIFDKPFEPAILAKNLGIASESYLGQFVDYTGTAARMVSKELVAEDAIFKTLQYRMSIASQAVREATLSGKRGTELRAEIARLQADPSDVMIRNAHKDAGKYTFTNDFTDATAAGQLMVRAQQVAANPYMRMTFTPFFKVPMRITEVALDHTPGLNMALQAIKGDFTAGGERAALARAKVVTSFVLLGGLMTLASAGLITGTGPRNNKPAYERWLRTRQPNSIQTTEGNWLSMQGTEPFASLAGLAADMAEMSESLSDKAWDKMVSAYAVSLAQNVTNKSYFQNITDGMEAIYSGDNSKITSWVQNFTASLAVPGIVSQTRALVDPYVREREGVWNEVVARTWWSGGFMPKRDLITGEPIFANQAVAPFLWKENQKRTDSVSKELERLKIGLSAPDKAVYGYQVRQQGILADLTEPTNKYGVQLSDEGYDRLMVLMTQQKHGGKNLQDKLTELVASPEYQNDSDGIDGGKAWKIKNIIEIYKRAGATALMQESPELEQAVMELMRVRAQALQPVR